MRLKPEHLQPVIMAGIMAFLMTGLITWLNLGLPSNFLSLWVRAFAIAWPAAAVAAFIAIPIAQRRHVTGRRHARRNSAVMRTPSPAGRFSARNVPP